MWRSDGSEAYGESFLRHAALCRIRFARVRSAHEGRADRAGEVGGTLVREFRCGRSGGGLAPAPAPAVTSMFYRLLERSWYKRLCITQARCRSLQVVRFVSVSEAPEFTLCLEYSDDRGLRERRTGPDRM